jgi:hypothetical protein
MTITSRTVASSHGVHDDRADRRLDHTNLIEDGSSVASK